MPGNAPVLDALALQYRRLLETVDAWFVRSGQRVGEQIRCSEGCSGCCRGLFDITLLDAYLLQVGFSHVQGRQRQQVLARAKARLHKLQRQWPDFGPPYLLNALPDFLWTEMPEDDLTPCPLLDENGSCLIYDWRPLICRQHGLPNIDLSGTSFSDLYCTLNFPGTDPLAMPEFRWDFRGLFEQEMALFGAFTTELFGAPVNEADTFIPTALFIDFSGFSAKQSG
jgi:Fe-S-cluster containining protein